MKLKRYDEVPVLPDDVDEACVDLCNLLNRLPGVETSESCCGHGKDVYSIWFRCDDVGTLSRLGRCCERNYSDGNFEIVVDSCDTDPYGLFWLRSKKILVDADGDEDYGSVYRLAANITYWVDDKFDEYFEKNK